MDAIVVGRMMKFEEMGKKEGGWWWGKEVVAWIALLLIKMNKG